MSNWIPRGILQRIANLVFGLFQPQLPFRAHHTAVVEQDTPEDFGHFTHLGDVLSQLDEYFDVMRLIKKDDPEAYNAYRHIGGQILPSRTKASADDLEPFVARPSQMPSMFMVANLYGETDSDVIWPVVSYFQKMTFSEGVAKHHGVLYRCVAYFADKKDKSLHFPMEYYIDVLDGSVRVLKQRRTTWQRLKRGGGISRTDWFYPRTLEECVSEYNSKHDDITSIHDVAKSVFTWAVNATVMASASARVSVRKGSIAATLNVDVLRTPQFFADRDIVLGNSGTRKRIFHIVRTHARQTARGVQYVKSHFRGERKFMWNGYSVQISMPGKHGINPMEVNIASVEGEMSPRTITTGKFAAIIGRAA